MPNVEDAVWVRDAALPDFGGMAAPDLAKMMAEPGEEPPTEIVVPQPRIPREEQQEQYTRDIEIDPHKYYPPDVYKEPLIKLPDPMVMKLPPKKK